MEAQIVVMVIALLVAFLPFSRGNSANVENTSIQSHSSVMSAILNQATTIGFQSGDCSL